MMSIRNTPFVQTTRASDGCSDPRCAAPTRSTSAIGNAACAAKAVAEKAAATAKVSKQRKLLRRVDALLRKLATRVRKATKQRKLSAPCGQTIDGLVATGRQTASALVP